MSIFGRSYCTTDHSQDQKQYLDPCNHLAVADPAIDAVDEGCTRHDVTAEIAGGTCMDIVAMFVAVWWCGIIIAAAVSRFLILCGGGDRGRRRAGVTVLVTTSGTTYSNRRVVRPISTLAAVP